MLPILRMTGEQLQALMSDVFGKELMFELARKYKVIQRQRCMDLIGFVLSLIFTGGTEECGRQYAVLSRYLENGAPKVVRGAFYAWFTEPLEMLLSELLRRALQVASTLPKLLPGILGTVSDWLVVDSSTVVLRHKLVEQWKGCGEYAALKIHKQWSVGLGNLVKYHLSPARESDSKHLTVDASRRGTGLLVDLGYASHDLLRDCKTHNVKYVIRLKSDWKFRPIRLVVGRLNDQLGIDSSVEMKLSRETVMADDEFLDADVEIGDPDKPRIHCRLIGVPTPKGYCLYLTNLSRDTHDASQVGDLYRVRWEIEIDNKVDKTGAQLDRISAETPVSVRILILASLLNATLARIIVQRHKLELYDSREINPVTQQPEITRPPLHPILMVKAMRVCASRVGAALHSAAPSCAPVPIAPSTTKTEHHSSPTPAPSAVIPPSEATHHAPSDPSATTTHRTPFLNEPRMSQSLPHKATPTRAASPGQDALDSSHAGRTQADPSLTTSLHEWDELIDLLVHMGHDPNWRRRPSVLDRLQGLVASPARPRKSKAVKCGIAN